MNDQARNVRTLIVCFVIAIMALIPLRFVEDGQQRIRIYEIQRAQVLGEMTEKVSENKVERLDPASLSAPYDEIDGQLFSEDYLGN